MADQKLMKKRLKVLMQRPENQICSDCPEKKPTWASLIAPPPDAPPGTEKLGAFVCLECSGSHRRLGVHIAFVRSVNLDSWKEWEVRAMENGGNTKVNGIFEARLAQSGRPKPTNLADGPTRERFIRDKYERRKFYDAAGFLVDYSTVSPPPGTGAPTPGSVSGSQPRPGAPSDIARQRVANRQALMKPSQSNVFDSQPAGGHPTTKVAQAPVSAPVVFDLLDFGSDPTPAPAAAPPVAHDPFAAPSAMPVANLAASTALPKVAPPPASGPGPTTATTSSTLMQEFMGNPSPAPKPAASNDSIMALFGQAGQAKQQQQQQQQQHPVYGMPAMAGMGQGAVSMGGMNNNNMMMTNGMMPQPQNHGSNNMNAFAYPAMMVNPSANNQMAGNVGFMAGNTNTNTHVMMMQKQQQQQQQMMMMQNMMMGGGGNPMGMNPQQMQQQQQMMMMMMQQQNAAGINQAQMTNPSMMNMNMGMPGAMNTNNQVNTVVNGMQGMSIGNPVAQHSSDDGGFGTPMGGSAPQQSLKNDPFGSLGGMNAFR